MKYDYKCEKCGKTVEIEKGMNDPSPTKCPLCGEEGLKRIYELSGVVYKVGGFYCHP
jgi:putative FmdB family regulatory protein